MKGISLQEKKQWSNTQVTGLLHYMMVSFLMNLNSKILNYFIIIKFIYHVNYREGFEVLKPVGTLKNTYLVRHKETHSRVLRDQTPHPSRAVTDSLRSNHIIKWAEQVCLSLYFKKKTV